MADKFEGDDFEKINQNESKSLAPQKLTGFLVLCCVIVTLGPIQFGLNISSLNSVSDIVKEFIRNDTFLFKEYHAKKSMFATAESYLNGNETRMKNALYEMENMRSRAVECRLTFDFDCLKEIEAIRDNRTKMIREKFNMSVEDYLPYIQNMLKEKRELLESNRGKLRDGEQRVDKLVELVWAILNSLFTVGGMIGALGSKFVMDAFGRKGALIAHNFVSIIAAVLALISPYVHSPVCLMISRFLYGVFSGATCSITPTYLTEISPINLRGRTGVLPQLGITFGILVSQILGFQQLLGRKCLWNFQLSTPLVLAIISTAFIFFFPESPAALLRKDPHGAKKALQKFRNTDNVNQELKIMTDELNANKNSNTLSLIEIFKVKDLRWPLILTFVLHIAQQLSGINAIFFYATDIFKSANIPPEQIQYATLSTGVVNFFVTIAVIPLIDRLGRKLLLVVPIFIILADFCGLTIFLSLKDKSFVFPILAIACVLIFIISFAIGLGPIPFIYTAESFRENARSSAMALAIMVNWTSTLVLTLTFPFLAKIIHQYVFLIFSGVMGLVLVILIPKMVESKGKTTEEIIAEYN